MIDSRREYEWALEQLSHLEQWLQRLGEDHPLPEKGLTRAGVRKMIARLHEELAEYERTAEFEKSVT